MKFWAPLLALVALATAQQENAINHPNGGLQVTAGEPFTLTWANPSSGTVTIKLQQGAGVTSSTGITLISVPAHDLTATFTIPADEVNTSQYNFEIVDDTDPSNVNFSVGFSIAGATCVGTCDGSSSSSASASASSASASASASASSSESSASASSTSSESAAASSASASASSASASASSASASATAAVTTSAPSSDTGAASSLRAQAGLVVAVVAAIAAF